MRKAALILGTLLLLFVAIAATHDVGTAATAADARAARQLVGTSPAGSRPATFEAQLSLIRLVQDRVLDAAPINREIPQGQPRELPDLIKAGHGLCFDRSRAIETVLRLHGMRTRHAAIYSTEGRSALAALATPGVASHAVTEVETSRGWMIVDSNSRWLGLTGDGSPVALAQLREQPGAVWHASVEAPLPDIFGSPFTWVYGLYSRHGRFYPPYDPVPDLNWNEVAQNI